MQFRLRFTLRDLMVAVVVISLLFAFLVPYVERARDQARRQQCKGKLQQIGVALHQYHLDFGFFPPGIVADSPDLRSGLHSGWTILLPYVGQVQPYNAYNFEFAWSHPANHTAIGHAIDLFVCPANRRVGVLRDAGLVAGVTDYGLCKGATAALCLGPDSPDFPTKLQGFFDVNSHVRIRDVKDGTASTIMVGEIAGGPGFDGITSNGTRAQVDQAWAKADFDDSRVPSPGGLGSVLGVVLQHPGPNGDAWWQSSAKGGSPVWARINARPLTAPHDASLDISCQNSEDRVNEFRSVHRSKSIPRGSFFLFGDGTVRFISDNADSVAYGELGTVAGGEWYGDSF